MKYLVITVIVLTVAVYSNTVFALEVNKSYIKVSVGEFTHVTSEYVNTGNDAVFVVIDDNTDVLRFDRICTRIQFGRRFKGDDRILHEKAVTA